MQEIKGIYKSKTWILQGWKSWLHLGPKNEKKPERSFPEQTYIIAHPCEIDLHKGMGLLLNLACCCSVSKSCLTLWDPMYCSRPGFPVLHYLLEFAQTHIHWVDDAIQPFHPLSPSSPALNLSQHQGLVQGIGFSHQVAKVLELQLQHQSFQWIFRTDFL